MIQEFMSWYTVLAKENPIIASAFGVGLGGWLLMTLRSLPIKILGFIKSRLITTLTITNCGYSNPHALSFMTWFNMKSGWGHHSRALSLEQTDSTNQEVAFGSGFGVNFFMWRGRLFWFKKNKLNSSGTHMEKFEIVLTMLGRNQTILKNLVDEFKYRKDRTKLAVHVYKSGWHTTHHVRKRAKESVIINEAVSKVIFGKIDEFVENRDWYYARGLPYKLCMMFTGIPGSGKTSLSRVIGSHYDRDVYTLSLSGMNDDRLRDAFHSVPSGSIIQVEDFDAFSAAKSRTLTALEPKERAALDEVIKDTNLMFVSADDLEKETIASIVFEMGSIDNLTIVEHQTCPGRYFYWDKYASDPIVHTIWTVLDPADATSKETKIELFDSIHENAALINRMNGGSNTANGSNGLTASGLFNALDGIIPLDDQIVLLTTNHPEMLDSALVRKGRIDYTLALNELKDPEVRKYVKLMFPEVVIPEGIQFKPIAGCNLQAIFYDHKFDGDAFLANIPKILMEAKP